ncbi:MAG: choice-of-anchor B family protein [Gemmatimonadetes bacterium]|nr:MAG: choice-of-anchor B family protein [Gemmatimonadota bacterium]
MRFTVALIRSGATLGLTLISLTTWGQAQTAHIPPAAGAGAMTGFATAIALAGGEILVSRTGQSSFIPLKADRAGAVHVFRATAAGSWAEAAIIEAADGVVGNEFGDQMAVGGGTLAVVAPNDGDGIVYLFTRDGDAWSEAGSVVASVENDSLPAEAFGDAVAVHGDLLFVAAPRQNKAAGAVYVFRRTGDGWTQTAMITASDGAATERFGSAMAFDGTDLLISAPRAARRRGKVYVLRHDADTQAWIEVAQLDAAVDKPVRFGTRLALAGGLLAVAPGSRANQNGISIYQRNDSGEWSAAGNLMPDSTAKASFGRAIALAGGDAWVGEPAFERHGRVHHFTRASDGSWSLHGAVAPDDLGPNAFFGGSVAATTDLVVVGALGTDIAQGTGYVYQQNASGEWALSAMLEDHADDMTAIIGSEVRCQDGTAGQFDCSDMDVLAFIPTGQLGAGRGVLLNDLWGWTDPETGREYAIVGRFDATVFIDITDPTNPVWLGELPMHEGAQANFWRDMKVYADHVFIVADGAGLHGMQVFDLRQLRSVTTTPAMFEETAHYDGIASSHNIVINEETGYAYAVGASGGGETCGGAFHMINIQDPSNPTFAGCFGDTNAGRRGTGYTHDAQCVLYHGPDEDYQGKEICFGSSETALTIADVTDKDNPVAIAAASYPNVGYAHQGWLTDDHRFFYLNDEIDELSQELQGTRTLIWDLTDLDDPIMVKEHFGTTKSSDHNLYVRGNLMYQSNYVSGLRVLDISDPENPVEVGFFDTVPFGDNGPGFGGSWSNYPFFESGTIVVTSSREGVFLLKKRPTEMTP